MPRSEQRTGPAVASLVLTRQAPAFVGLRALADLGDLIRNETVCFAVDSLRYLLTGGIDQAEDLTRILVVPVLEIVDPVLPLDLKVLLVRLRRPLRSTL